MLSPRMVTRNKSPRDSRKPITQGERLAARVIFHVATVGFQGGEGRSLQQETPVWV